MQGRKPEIEIKEDIEYLKKLYQNEKHSKKKERLHALYLLKSQKLKSIKQLDNILGRDRSTISLWFRAYREGGLIKYLNIGTSSGRNSQFPKEVEEKLIERLKEPTEGFNSYIEIQHWLKDEFNLDLPYKTVHGYVKYRLDANLKVPRPFNIKRDEEKVEEFKKKISKKLEYEKDNIFSKLKRFKWSIEKKTLNLLEYQEFYKKPKNRELKVFFQDESRFGLITDLGRKITLKGVKPVGLNQFTFKYSYYYGAIEPLNGDSFFIELPSLNTEYFQTFINELSKEFEKTHNILILDNARFHYSKSLKIPNNISLIFLPPYSPDLNPIERFWQDIKKIFKSKIFTSLKSLMDKVFNVIDKVSNETIKSISGFQYILNFLKLIY